MSKGDNERRDKHISDPHCQSTAKYGTEYGTMCSNRQGNSSREMETENTPVEI